MLEFVDSDLYFVQDNDNFINPLLQVGSGSGSVEKSTGCGAGGPKITGSGSSSLLISDSPSLFNVVSGGITLNDIECLKRPLLLVRLR